MSFNAALLLLVKLIARHVTPPVHRHSHHDTEYIDQREKGLSPSEVLRSLVIPLPFRRDEQSHRQCLGVAVCYRGDYTKDPQLDQTHPHRPCGQARRTPCCHWRRGTWHGVVSGGACWRGRRGSEDTSCPWQRGCGTGIRGRRTSSG